MRWLGAPATSFNFRVRQLFESSANDEESRLSLHDMLKQKRTVKTMQVRAVCCEHYLAPWTTLNPLCPVLLRKQYWPSLTAWGSEWRERGRPISSTTGSWIVTTMAEHQPARVSTTVTNLVSRRLLKVEIRSVCTIEPEMCLCFGIHTYIHTYIRTT